MATYTYSISGDFPNGKVCLTRLTQEIQASAIVTALDSMDTSGDNCNIHFKGTLSTGDETILDGIVAAHTGAPMGPEVELAKLVDTDQLDPSAANTKIKGYSFNAAANGWTNFDTSFPYDVDLLQGFGYNPNANNGDKFDFIIAPDAVVAGLAVDCNISDPSITVNSAQYLKPGYSLKIGNSGATLHHITAISGNVVSLDPVVDADVSAGADILRSVKYMDGVYVSPAGTFQDLGGQTFGAVTIPAGTTLRVSYYNSHASEAIDVPFALVMKY